jgi:hypothetical protein
VFVAGTHAAPPNRETTGRALLGLDAGVSDQFSVRGDLPGSSLPLNGSATAVSRCIARIARGITTWVEAYEAAANVDKTYRIAVLVRLRSSDAGDGDHQIGLGPFNPALGHGFGNLPADGGMAGEQLTGDTQGRRLMDFAINDEAAVQRVSGARSLGQKVNQCSGRA